MLDRWSTKLGLLLAMTVLLSLAFAPVGQFYLAWIGLVPWLVVVRESRTNRAAFFWSWLGGTLFFAANMWWLWKVTVPGMFALLIYLGAFFGYASLFLRAARLIEHRTSDGSIRPARFVPVLSTLLIATVWSALEYIRGNWSMFGNQGLPWLNLGVTQTPFVLMCQVADFGSGYAVSFWIVALNFAIFFCITSVQKIAKTDVAELNRVRPYLIPWRSAIGALAVAAALVTFAFCYGFWRLSQTQPLSPGPVVLVIQPDYPQDNSGAKGAPRDEILDFHVRTTADALHACATRGQKIDLVVWSETMMPPLNGSALEIDPDARKAMDAISNLAFEFHTPLLVGFEYKSDWQAEGRYLVPHDKRNSALLVNATGTVAEQRYDKIHLVPFGEFIPFESIGWIHSILLKLGPSGYEDYVLTPGTLQSAAIFNLDRDGQNVRFATPICFEDLVSDLVASMVRGQNGTKRVDLLVNLTNDGWFLANEMPQHLQASIFRSIENRVPTARSVNNGVSAFIDSVGRVHDRVAPSTAGWSASQVMFDDRVTLYTRFGDFFPVAALFISVILAGYSVVVRRKEAK